MSAGPELRAYGANLNQAQANVAEVRGLVGDVRDRLDTVEMVIDAIDVIETQADRFGHTVARMEQALKLMDKAGPLKALATLGAFVLDKVEAVARAIESKAHALARRIDDSGLEKVVERAQDKLDQLELGLAAVEDRLAGRAEAIADVVRTLDTVDALDPNGDPAAPLAAGIESLVALPNDAVGALNAAYAGIRSDVQALHDAVPGAGFLPALQTRIAFDKVGFIFDIVVRPAIDFLLHNLGLQRVMDSLADRITSLLPAANVFDGMLERFDLAFDAFDPLASLGDALGVEAWVDALTTDLIDPLGDPVDGPIGIGGDDADVLVGSTAADALNAGAGDDVLLAGPGVDVLDGGAGTDRLVFRGNLVEYRFSQGASDADLVVNHVYPADPRAGDGSEITRNVEVFDFADLSLTRTQLLGSVRIAAPGQTLLQGSDDTDILFAATTAITIDGAGGTDVIGGSPGNDTLRGGAGDDIVVRSGGNDSVDGGTGRDTWRFGFDNAIGNPHVDVDLQRGSALVGGTTTALVSIEAIVVEDARTAYLFGSAQADQLTAAGSRDLIDGRDGDDVLDGGGSEDVLIGGRGADALRGGDGNDVLAAGSAARAGVADQYDGGSGIDTLTYASDLRELVTREHFDVGLRNKARLQEASGPLRVHGDTGVIERLAADGVTVVATDTAVGIEAYVGSDAADVLFGGPGEDASIDGGGGDDTLYGGLAGGDVGGGSGDDIVHAGIGGARVDGGSGYDILDLAQPSGVRWLVRLDGSLGSALRAFNAVDGNDLALPGGSLQNESGPSLLASGNVEGFELIRGGEGDDHFTLRSHGLITVHAGGGDDIVQGRSGGDSNPSFALHGDAGNDHIVLQDEGLADGGEGDDRLEAMAASANAQLAIAGGPGDDVIVLWRGVFAIEGGEGQDTLRMPDVASSALSVDLGAGSVQLGGVSGSVAGIETVIGADGPADTLRGSAADEAFIGGGGNDSLDGLGGADALYGGDGADRLQGGEGDDWLHGGAGADRLDGGAGIDVASWAFGAPGGPAGALEASGFGSVTADLAEGVARLSRSSGGSETDTLLNIENLVGGAGNDTLLGDAGANLLAGGAGADLLDGRGGDDVLALVGDDQAFGGEGSDRFVAGLGQVRIDGGPGLDTIEFALARADVQLDAAAGRYATHFTVEQAVWRDGGGTQPRTSGAVTLTPREVLEADAAFADTPDDVGRTVPAGAEFAIGFSTGIEAAGGRFDGIERLHFTDGGVALDLDGAAGEVARLLGAVFGPAAVHNREWVGIGLRLKDAGLSYQALAAEAVAASGVGSHAGIVTLLWTHLVGSAPSAEQAQPYIEQLGRGMSVGELARFAADLPLNAANIDLVGLAASGIEFA
jgi:Ca2+-binding RTX toxin-like protein